MPQAVARVSARRTRSCREHRAFCLRSVVARKSPAFTIAVNRRLVLSRVVRASAFASRPVVTLGQAAGSAAGLSRRQLPRPSLLPSVSVGSSAARCVARAAASPGKRVPVSFCR
jgi:hypothetical protein